MKVGLLPEAESSFPSTDVLISTQFTAYLFIFFPKKSLLLVFALAADAV